jgi:hypothetical protein
VLVAQAPVALPLVVLVLVALVAPLRGRDRVRLVGAGPGRPRRVASARLPQAD